MQRHKHQIQSFLENLKTYVNPLRGAARNILIIHYGNMVISSSFLYRSRNIVQTTHRIFI